MLDPRLKEAVKGPAARTVMVIGGPDTGKTTLVEALAGHLSKEGATAILDLDMGQSRIGPPSTMGWAVVEGGFRGWDNLNAEGIYFIGALSPPGNLLPSITGAKLLLERALAQCGRVIIDTTGLVSGPVGRVYKQYKIELLKPDVVIAIEQGDGLDGILSQYRSADAPRIVRVAPPKGVRIKTPEARADYRGAMFREYFSSSRTVEVDLNKTGVRYTGDIDSGPLKGRLVSFRESSGNDVSIGMIEEADGPSVLVRTPLKEGQVFSMMVIGRVSITIP